VISLAEERFWRETHSEMIQDERDNVAKKIASMLRHTKVDHKKKNHEYTAEIIDFPQERIA